MGFLDELKDKAEEFGDKTKEGFGTAKDKASDLIGDAKDRFNKDDEGTSADKVEEAVNYDPGAVEAASAEGIGEAAAGATSETSAAPAPVGTSEAAGASEPFGEPASATAEPPTTPDEAYEAVLDDAAKTDEYRSDSTP